MSQESLLLRSFFWIRALRNWGFFWKETWQLRQLINQCLRTRSRVVKMSGETVGRTYEWVMSQIWTSHTAHMNESCLTYERVMSHIWISHVSHMNESCRTYEWVMSQIWTSHVAHSNTSRHTDEWVMSDTNTQERTEEWLRCEVKRHVTLLNESRHTYEWVMSDMWTRNKDRKCGSDARWKGMSHIWTCHVMHTNESHDTYTWGSHTYESVKSDM